MLVEEELSKEIPVKIGNNRRNNYQNMDNKASSSKEVYTVNCTTEYTSIGSPYTQALQWFLAEGRSIFPKLS